MYNVNTQKSFLKTISQLNTLNTSNAQAVYEIGETLQKIVDIKAYDLLGSKNARAFCDKHLNFSYSVMGTYTAVYRHTKRLGYTEKQAVKLIERYGKSRVLTVASRSEDRSEVDFTTFDVVNSGQVTFNLMNKKEVKLLDDILMDYGMEFNGDRRAGVKDAFVALLHDVKGKKKPAKRRAAA